MKFMISWNVSHLRHIFVFPGIAETFCPVKRKSSSKLNSTFFSELRLEKRI